MQHNVVGITGPFGSGKSLYAMQLAIKYAEKARKPIYCNFPVNIVELRKYARRRGYHWVASCARIAYVELFDDLNLLWKYRDCVFVFDEGGVFANSRSFKSMPKEFLKNLFQVRKLNVHLLIVFQFYEQVDKQIRLVFQHWVRCKSISVYDKKLGAPRLLVRYAFHYTPEKFLRLEEDTKARGNMILPWLWSDGVFWRVLVIHQLLVLVQNRLLEFYCLGVYMATAGGRLPRPRYQLTQESGLFRIFSSTGLVGDVKKKRTWRELPPFVTQSF